MNATSIKYNNYEVLTNIDHENYLSNGNRYHKFPNFPILFYKFYKVTTVAIKFRH